MGYDSYASTTKTSSPPSYTYTKSPWSSIVPGASSDHPLNILLSYILLPPLLLFYAIAYQFLLLLDTIDRLAENPLVKKIVTLSARAIAIGVSIVFTIWGWLTAPLNWFAETFVWKALYTVYRWVSQKVKESLKLSSEPERLLS